MLLTLNRPNCEWGFQKFASQAVESVLLTLHRSFDYTSKASSRELLTFFVFSLLLQGVLIPVEGYPALRADIAMLTAAGVTDLVVCILPFVALVWRWTATVRNGE